MRFKRLIVASFLIVLLYLICINYASTEYNIAVNELFFDHPGEHVFVFGEVVNIYHNGFEVSINENENYTIYQTKTLSKANLGDIAYILGTLDSPTEITAVKIMTLKESSTNFVILRSFLGLILFLLIFLSYWKFDPKKMLFKRRKK